MEYFLNSITFILLEMSAGELSLSMESCILLGLLLASLMENVTVEAVSNTL